MVAEAPDQALMAAETPGPRGAPVTPALASAAHVYLEFAGDIPRHGLYLYDAGVLPEFPGSPPPMQLAPPDGPSLPAHHGPRQQKRAAVMQWWRRLRGSDNNAIACALRVCPGHKRERGLAPKALDPSCIKAVLRCLQGPNFLGGSGRWNYSQPALDPQEHAAMAQIFDRSRVSGLRCGWAVFADVGATLHAEGAQGEAPPGGPGAAPYKEEPEIPCGTYRLLNEGPTNRDGGHILDFHLGRGSNGLCVGAGYDCFRVCVGVTQVVSELEGHFRLALCWPGSDCVSRYMHFAVPTRRSGMTNCRVHACKETKVVLYAIPLEPKDFAAAQSRASSSSASAATGAQ